METFKDCSLCRYQIELGCQNDSDVLFQDIFSLLYFNPFVLFESFFFVFAISIYHHSLLPFSLVFLIFFVRLNFLLYLTVLLKLTCSAAKAAPFQEFSFTSRDSAHFN